MVRWEKAIEIVTGEEVKVHDLRTGIRDPDERQRLRSLKLFDVTKEFRLFPRFGDKRPHFFCPVPNKPTERREEVSKEHNTRRDFLLQSLKDSRGEVGYFVFDGEREPRFEPLFPMDGYSWETEVRRGHSNKVYWQHDLFGAASALSTSVKAPWFAIEVVDTHYPEPMVWKHWLALTAIFPYVIAFDMARTGNYFLDVGKSQTRIVYYMFDGSIWKSGVKKTGSSPEILREMELKIIKPKPANPFRSGENDAPEFEAS